MLKKKTVLKFILGLKIRQLRIRRELSLKELADLADLSVSYLNEIEKGKKYPKIEKLAALADGLKIDLGELLSFKTGRNLHPLLKFMESDTGEQIPLELFGVSEADVVELMGHDPEKFASFVLTMLQLSRAYDLKVEDVYAAALRSYIEAHGNYFSEIEKTAKKMRSEWSLSSEENFYEELKQILQRSYNYEIDENLLGEDDLLDEQKILSKRGKLNKLYLHPLLTKEQKTFYLACELGHVILGFGNEKFTSSYTITLQKYKTRYFAGALLIDEKNFTKDLKHFFSQQRFDGASFIELIQKYKVSAETFFHRLTQMLSAHFKTDDIFYLEVHDEEGRSRIRNELHLTQLHGPHGVRMNEHYCERWIAVKSLKQIQSRDLPVAMAQISVAENGSEYFSLSHAEFSSHQKRGVSFTLGFAIKPELRQFMKFLDDKILQRVEIGQTCERCSNLDCQERTVPATLFLNKKMEEKKVRKIVELTS